MRGSPQISNKMISLNVDQHNPQVLYEVPVCWRCRHVRSNTLLIHLAHSLLFLILSCSAVFCCHTVMRLCRAEYTWVSESMMTYSAEFLMATHENDPKCDLCRKVLGLLSQLPFHTNMKKNFLVVSASSTALMYQQYWSCIYLILEWYHEETINKNADRGIKTYLITQPL